MSQLLIANIGSYPRIGDHKDQQRHRRGFGHYERKDISAHAFRDVEQSVIQEIVGEQLSCGLDEVTDGLVAWQDPISHFCRNIRGFKIAGLFRYFNTNFYYRQPVLISKPHFTGPVVSKEFSFAQNISHKPIRAILTGPFTLACHTRSEIKLLNKVSKRFEYFSDIIAQEIKALDEAGAQVIQIDEPSLVMTPMDFDAYGKFLAKMIGDSSRSIKFVLAFYFSPLASSWAKMQTLPVQALQLDLTVDGNDLLNKMLAKPGTKEIGLGLLDSRNTRLEAPEPICHRVRQWLQKTGAPMCYLTPSAGLEFLPRANALAKLQHLRLLANEITKEDGIETTNV